MAVNPFSMVRPIAVADSATFGSFTRATNGTYIGKDGLLKTAGVNEPRFNHDPISKASTGLLIESAATNYITQSDMRAATSHTVASGTITDNGLDSTVLGPDGFTGARKVTVTAAGTVRWGVTTGIATGLTHAGSVWVKTADGSTQTVNIDINNDTTQPSVVINGTTWTRLTGTGANGLSPFRFMDLNLPIAAYHIFGAQVEDTAVSSYFSTTTVAATRAADSMGCIMVSEVPDACTNFFSFPEDLDQSSGWSLSLATVAANAVAAPLPLIATSNADCLTPDATNGLHSAATNVTLPTAFNGQAVTFSTYLRSNGYSGAVVRITDTSQTSRLEAAIDLAAGTVLGVTLSNTAIFVGASITPVTGQAGWYRVSVSAIIPGINVYQAAILVFQTGASAVARTVFVGSAGQGVYVWANQFHLGANALPYLSGAAWAGAPASTGGNDPFYWVSTTIYAAGNQVTRSVAGGVHNIYQKLNSGGVTTPAPELDTTNWILVGAINKWKMFDAANESQTLAADEINFTLKPNQLADTLVFDNLDADSVRVFIPGTSYDTTIATKVRACSNWYQYFFEPFVQKKSAVFASMPLVTTNVINVSVRKVTSPPKIGTCVVGLSRVIGTTEPGATVGIIDYSTKSTDQFGNTSVVKRAYSKRMTVSVIIENSDLDAVQDLLAQYRSSVVAWLGAGTLFNSMTILGFYRSFDTVIAYPTQSRCSMEIEGLT